ncbi:MAG: type V CRISPR-associated protein Cas12a/Cpf1 [Succinivibrionaceae bacterium]
MGLIKSFNENVGYQKSITLKNELKPIGKTLDYIIENKVIEKDEKRNDDYILAKEIIDSFHREFIDNSLACVKLDWSDLVNCVLNDSNDEKYQEKLEKLQDAKRGEIVKLFKNSSYANFDDIFKEKLFNDILPSKLTDESEKKVIRSFCKFTTYFKGFFENRKNVYSSEAISTSIAYRIVHENFPKFLSNLRVFNKLQEVAPKIITELNKQLKNLLSDKSLTSLNQIFAVDFLNSVLNQKGIDFYNQVISEINQIINISMQPDLELKEILKKNKCAKMGGLYKQILSDRESKFNLDLFDNDQDVIDSIKKFYEYSFESISVIKKLISSISPISPSSPQPYMYEDLKGIKVQGKSINFLSKELFGSNNWDLIRNCIENAKSIDKQFLKIVKKNGNDLDKTLSKQDFSIYDLNEWTKEFLTQNEFLNQNGKKLLIDSFVDVFEGKISLLLNSANNINWPEDLQSKENKNLIKELLDCLLNIYRYAAILSVKSFDINASFYNDYDVAIHDLSSIVHLYNKTRIYCTKKPYSSDKFKLNFDSSQLAEGWTETKLNDHLSIIFLKEDKYYLGIYNKNNKKDINFEKHISSKDCYRRMKYFQFKDIRIMLPKCTVTVDDVKEHFANNSSDYELFNSKTFNKKLIITKEIFDLGSAKDKKFQKEYKKVNEAEYRDALKKWITFAIEFLHCYKTTSLFDIHLLKSPEEYEYLTDFYDDVNSLTYKLEFVDVDSKYIDQLVNEGKLYLFQIYNKDFAAKTTGKKNLHTMYLQSIFDERNLQEGIVKLNGNAEIFFRKKSIDSKNIVKHSKGSTLVNKLYINKDGKNVSIPDNLYKEICDYENKITDHLSEKAQIIYKFIKTKEATHDIVKDNRFTVDKFQFHCPITINYKKPSKVSKFNEKVLKFLKNNKDVNIIGIDRGERNLLYITVINQNGDILKSISFNTVSMISNDKVNNIDYHEKLLQKEKERLEEKRSWDSVSKIATLKEGYLSAVIHQIALLMVEYNAIVVLENLNVFFKRIRHGIAERSVYQKFEKMLIDKLNYLVFKSEDWCTPGGLLNGLQLTNKFTKFEEVGQQSGFLFYVPASFTSKIDPTTGFANTIKMGELKNSDSQKKFITSFDSISYDQSELLFRFDVDFSKFHCIAEMYKTKWSIYSYGTRILREKDDQGHYYDKDNYNPTEELIKLFKEYNIDYISGKNLISVIDKVSNSSFWIELFKIFKNILQMRNSVSGGMRDYLVSPVKGKNGDFYNSETCLDKYPKDADANGAYHIALKGLLIMNKNNIAKTKDELKKVKTISNKEWFEYVQKERLH